MVIAEWNFEDAAKRSVTDFSSTYYTADDGIPLNKDIAEIKLNGPLFTSFVRGSGGIGTSAPNSDNWMNGTNTKYWFIEFNTTGYKSITLSSSQRSSDRGPKYFSLQVRSDLIIDWTSVADIIVGSGPVVNPDFITGTISNIPLPDIVSNSDFVTLRWLMTSETDVTEDTVLAAGTNRIDDIVIRGIPIPHIVSVTPVTGIELACGEFSHAQVLAELPSTTTILDSEGTSHDVDLTWGGIQGYNPNIPGSYPVTASFELPDGVIQSDPMTPLEVSTTITVLAGTREPAFDPIGPFCQGETAHALPGQSVNEIFGTWLPPDINTSAAGSFGYTFTPAAGQCAVEQTISIDVDEREVPIFEDIDPLCQGEDPPDLPTTSLNDIAGTWNPATIITDVTRDYTFTPDEGFCSEPYVMRIVINSLLTPQFDLPETLCQGITPPVLEETDLSGVDGTWEPSAIDTQTVGSADYVFTPNEGQCADILTIQINIQETVQTEFAEFNFFGIHVVCESQTPFVLPEVSDNGIQGDWWPASITSSRQYSFTPAFDQCGTYLFLTVEVRPEITAHFDSFGPFCQGDDPAVLPLISLNNIEGVWWPETIDASVSGTSPYTFYATEELCVLPYIANISVNEVPVVYAGGVIEVPYGTEATLNDAVATGGANLSYSWSPESLFEDHEVLHPTTIALTENVVVTLTVTNEHGCSSSDQLQITVDGGPLQAHASADPIVVCSGEPVQLLSNVSGGAGAPVISWTSDLSGFESAEANPMVYPMQTTTYMLLVTDGIDIEESSVEVQVNPMPILSCPVTFSVCSNDDTFDITGALVDGAAVQEGYYMLDGNEVAEFDPSAYEPGNDYRIWYHYTNIHGCAALCSFVIDLHEAPAVYAGTDVVADYGTSVTLDEADASGTTDLVYHWSPEGIFVDHTVLHPTTIELTDNTLVTLTVTDNNGCSSSDQLQITIDGDTFHVQASAEPIVVCAGEQVRLFSNVTGGTGDLSFSWTSDLPRFESYEANPVDTPMQTTTYFLVVTDGNATRESSVEVKVNPVPPAPSIQQIISPGCNENNGKIILGGLPSGGWRLFPGGPELFSPTWTMTGLLPGQYRFRVISGGCESVYSEWATIDEPPPVPDVPVIDSIQHPQCGDPTFRLFISGLPEGSWRLKPFNINGSGPTYTYTGQLFGKDAMSYYVSVVYEDCESPGVQVVIIPSLVPEVTCYGPIAYCVNDAPVALNHASPAGGIYSGSGVVDGYFYPSVAGVGNHEIEYTYTDPDNGCENRCSFFVEVKALPEVKDLTRALCEDFGQEGIATGVDLTAYELSVSNLNGLTFSWYGDETLQVVVENPSHVTVSDGQSFYVLVEGANTCSNIATVTFSVTENIVLTDPTFDLCEDSPGFQQASGVNLTSYNQQVFSGDDSVSYTWLVETDGDLVPVETPSSVTISDGDAYRVEVKAGNCEAYATVTFDIVTLPAPPVASANPAVCASTPIQEITAQASVPEGYEKFWYAVPIGGEQVSAPVLNTIGSIIYYAEAFDGRCRSGSRTPVELTIHGLPEADIVAPSTVDYGDRVDLSAEVSGEGPFSYLWGPESVFDPDEIDTYTPSTLPLQSNTLITLTVTDDNGCSSSDQLQITLTGGPLSAQPYANPGSICAGEPVQLFANAAGGLGGYSYLWTSDASGEEYSIENPEVYPTTNTVYLLTVTDWLNDTVVESVSVLVHPPPEVSCPAKRTVASNATRFELEGGTPAGGTYYLNDMPVTHFDPSQVGMGSHAIEYLYRDENGCESHCSFIIEVVEELPRRLLVTFNVDMSHAKEFNPVFDKVYITGSMFNFAVPGAREDEQRLHPTDNELLYTWTRELPIGRYYYKYFLNEGWAGEEWPSAPIRIADISRNSNNVFNDYFGKPDGPTSVSYMSTQQIRVFPNPVQYTLYVSADGEEPLQQIRIINMLGQTVYAEHIDHISSYRVDVNNMPPGLYVVQVHSFTGWHSTKVQVIK